MTAKTGSKHGGKYEKKKKEGSGIRERKGEAGCWQIISGSEGGVYSLPACYASACSLFLTGRAGRQAGVRLFYVCMLCML